MTFFKTLTATTVALALAGSIAFAKGAAVVSAQQIDETSVSVTLLSQFHCNDPIVSFEYLYSNRATFGPHHYEVEVIGINRAHCSGPEEFTAVLPIPEELRVGDAFVINGEGNTSSYIVIE